MRRRERIAASATVVRFSTPTGTHCRIEDVVVDERLRGKGVGRKIMERTLSALCDAGVAHIELTSHPSRVAARALYRSLGFKPRKTGVFELRPITISDPVTCNICRGSRGAHYRQSIHGVM